MFLPILYLILIIVFIISSIGAFRDGVASCGVAFILLAIAMAGAGIGFSNSEEFRKEEIPHEATAKLEGDLIIITSPGLPTQTSRDVGTLNKPQIIEVKRWNIWGGALTTEYKSK